MDNFSIEELRPLNILEGLPDKILTWLSEHGTRIDLDTGDQMFEHGQSADFMFIIVSGKIQRFEDIGGQPMVVATTVKGGVTGMLPFSRMSHYPGDTVAAESSKVLRVNKDQFGEMLTVNHQLGQRLVAEMSNRVRGDVRLEQQQEKMASLGRLSAGLAHELNNPAAAISRSAASLTDHILDHSNRTMTIVKHDLSSSSIEAMESLRVTIRECEKPNLSTIEHSEREEEIGDWLEDLSLDEAWEIAAIFTDCGLVIKDLESIVEIIPEAVLGDVLCWFAGDIELDRMVLEIRSAAIRISELVTSVKSYSHMDQSIAHKPTNLVEGINNTLKLLGHRIKKKSIQLSTKYSDDLPAIPGNAGELNQVWTNLIDNAIDSMDEGGHLTLNTILNKDTVCVKVIDDGKGIPKEIRHLIFDPFFTTKIVGDGTGLGLDIVHRIVQLHGGNIYVESKPGETVFTVTLPLNSKTKSK